MHNSPNLDLPLVQPSQAQKHVTVNAALTRLDAATQLVLQEVGRVSPPASVAEGVCFGIGAGATGDWAGQDGRVAVADNGGWDFLDARPGWRAWDADAGRALVRIGDEWRAEGLGAAPSGAAARFVTVEGLHEIAPGADNVTSIAVPEKVTLFAVSARVVEAVTGGATGWSLGHAGAVDRFGAGLGTASGSYADGLLGQPQGYYAATPVVLTAEGGLFASGRLRIALHYIAYDLPGVS